MTNDETELRHRLVWLIKLRWAAIAGVLIATHALREFDVLSFSLIPVYLVLGIAAFCNLVYRRLLSAPRENLERLALAQIFIDQLILAAAVYFSGGGDSPLMHFFIFHVVISGIILPWRRSFVFAAIAALLPMLVLGLEQGGILPHYGIFRNGARILTDATVITSYGTAFISTVLLTSYFVASLSRRLHEKNEEIRRLYTLSERLRSSIRLTDVMAVVEQELRSLTGAGSIAYLPLDKERRALVMTGGEQELLIPLIDRNSFTDAALRGVGMIVDRRIVSSNYEYKALDRLGADRCMILPAEAASLQPCYRYFNCTDLHCGAYHQKENTRCWQVSGTHCKGAITGNAHDKLATCVTCELFAPVGVFMLALPKAPLLLDDVDMDSPLRLLAAAGLAVSNALLYERTMRLSKTDGLTGLRNHREFVDTLAVEVLRSQRYRRPFGLLMIDVDHFKRYNDANGHPQGNRVLKELAELLHDNFKNTDVVARYGGEEFVVLLLETRSKEECVSVAERLRSMVEWCGFPRAETQPNGRITVSIGVSYCPEDGQSADELIQAADEALYRAKQGGRNKVAAAAASREQRMSSSLEQACDAP
jgi:diguanylate cyclase (GGDEF)-like protein